MVDDPSDKHGYIFDPEHAAELARLIEYNRMLTQAMGGLLAEQASETIEKMHTVLDLACGPGGWVLDLAFTYPHLEVAGVDISEKIIRYAIARAQSQAIINASFEVMDITQPLNFADTCFDLVNARSIFGALPRTAWLPFIKECTRIICPGGILRLTEVIGGFSTSAAFERWNAWLLRALHLMDYGFSPLGYSINVTTVLPTLLRQAGYRVVRHVASTLDSSAGAPAYTSGTQSLVIAMHMSEPLLLRFNLTTTEELQQIINQFQIDMLQNDFCLMQHNLTVWSIKDTE